MKTLLLWGVGDTLSRHLTYQLSVDGHRLLVTGADFDKLQDLDAALCQSELHRFSTTVAPRAVAEWVKEQHLGLDGVVLVIPPPEPAAALLVPITANLRRVEGSVYAALELLRELLPQLRRGKRPKRALVLLAWDDEVASANVHQAPLVNLWRALIERLAEELEPDGVQVNAVLTASAPAEPPARSTAAAAAASGEEESESGPHTALVPCDAAVFAAGWFSAAFGPLNGQFIRHPGLPKIRATSQNSL